MADAVVISDLHLGSDNSQTVAVLQFLAEVREGTLPADQLVLNGDIFDSLDFRRLTPAHWRVLTAVRDLSDLMEVVWLNGNHDGPAGRVSDLLGVPCREEYRLTSGGRRILVLHGHRFDDFIDRHPYLTRAADAGYALLQRLDRSHRLAKRAKRMSKTLLRVTDALQVKAKEYARRHGFDAVCCGHTHLPVADESGPVAYYNGGSWVEKPCGFLHIANGEIEVRSYVTLAAREPIAVS